ncbi:hypothetical protein COCC4DRAFT_64020 [Bipolaris maydis ATCC 48331]|uniref:Uncharacterized protein n=2 Tax=Cochliobolus heterostrophus TaxID=5016 RepID=M2UDJ2_COCH5|nr:uncharacterized protein COCC4DRAFT_64020 [Bipolaris maydis ATCC 48331]EMD86058.1 hypothetical protein COCHEDRAFT_1160990 [Bipolaris maydis C5]ENI02061.1 hypothetical protein COCC4DRAFT_64020 [Bipolaris maydis ATCC 48331]
MVVHLDLALTLTPGATMPDRATPWPFVFGLAPSQLVSMLGVYYVPSALILSIGPGPGSWKTTFAGKPNFCRPLVSPSVAVVHAVFCHFTIAPRTARPCR